jgi:localization factor PodJL
MKQDLPWSVSGIPPEARDVARAAASRDGVSVGDWITRRILGETARTLSASERGTPVNHSYRNERDEETRRDREDLAQRLAKAEAETDGAFRRIDETLRSVARRMETTERSQNEAQRAMSAAAAEIQLATREQAQAFDHLNKRIDNVERQSDNSALRDAVRGLHQGLSRLADQIAKTATESAGQVGMIAQNVEMLANKLAQVRDEAALNSQVMDGRMSALSERMRLAEERVDSDSRSGEVERIGEIVQSLERTIDSIADRLAATEMLAINFARVETKVDGAEERMQEAMAKQLKAIEGSLAAVGERIEQAE